MKHETFNELLYNDSVKKFIPNKINLHTIDKILFRITNLYENNNKEIAIKLIEKHFDTKINSYDKYLGYITASYFYTNRFEKAAELILIRNKNKKQWDFSLKLDYAKCIRFYTITHTLMEGLALVDYHFSKYNSPIISHFWTSIPFEIMNNIENGIHSVITINQNMSINRIKELKYLISKYPNDPFIPYAYYTTKNFSKAIEFKKSRITDLLQYAYAYNNVRKISKKYIFNNDKKFYYQIPRNKIVDTIDIKNIKKSISAFKKYIALNKNGKHADDSAFWIAWLNTFLGDYNETFNWLNECQKLGNHDYSNICINYISYFFTTVDLNRATKDSLLSKSLNNLKLNETFGEKYLSYRKRKLLFAAFRKYSFNEIKKYYLANKIDKYIYEYIGILLRNGGYAKAKEIYLFLKSYDNNFNKRINNEYKIIINKLIQFESKENSYDKVISLILYTKNKIHNRRLALNLIDIAKNKYSYDSDKIEYLKYLEIRTLTIYNPVEVEKKVNDYVKKYSNSKYADDVLAELVMVYLKVLSYPEKGKKTLIKLLNEYPKGNAVDYTTLIY